jgi:hypothetical protein
LIFNKKGSFMFNKILFSFVLTLFSFQLHANDIPKTEQKSIELVTQMIDALREKSEIPNNMVRRTEQILSNRNQNEEVWPGYELSSLPMVIHFRNGHIYAFNFESKNPNWTQISVNGHSVLFSERDAWGVSKVPMHPAFPVDGEPAFVFSIDDDPMDPYLPFIILVHERFHLYQFGNFAMEEEYVEYVDHFNRDNLALMKLEEALLKAFLKSNFEQRTEIIKDFLAVNQERQRYLTPSSKGWEDHQQRMEGLADYVSVKLFDVNPLIPIFSSQQHILSTMGGQDDNSIVAHAIKWRHYAVGSILGYALDHLNVEHWKEQVGYDARSMIAILNETLPLSEQERQMRLEKVKEAYHFDEIQEKAVASLDAYQKTVADLLNEYQASDGIAIRIASPPRQGISGGGDSEKSYHLDSGSMLLVDNNSVDTSTDLSWRMRLSRAPFVFQGNGTKEFKADPDIEVKVDNKQYKLKDLQKMKADIAFSTIAWHDDKCEFNARIPGVIRSQQGRINILFN